MALITRKDLRNRAIENSITKAIAESSFEKLAKAQGAVEKQIFLSHAFLDADEILILKDDIEKLSGCNVYVDWLDDTDLDRSDVTIETANRIRSRMRGAECLLFAFSENSGGSRWMPWELGFFDGYKGKVAVVPIADVSKSSFNGVEYLSLYPYVDKATTKGGALKLWVQGPGIEKAIALESWIKA